MSIPEETSARQAYLCGWAFALCHGSWQLVEDCHSELYQHPQDFFHHQTASFSGDAQYHRSNTMVSLVREALKDIEHMTLSRWGEYVSLRQSTNDVASSHLLIPLRYVVLVMAEYSSSILTQEQQRAFRQGYWSHRDRDPDCLPPAEKKRPRTKG